MNRKLTILILKSRAYSLELKGIIVVLRLTFMKYYKYSGILTGCRLLSGCNKDQAYKR